MTGLEGFVRRHAALLVFLLAAAWIVTVVLLIIANPEPGTGNPMD
jgi:hypothetical protein